MAIRSVPIEQSNGVLITSYDEATDEQLMLIFQANDFRAFEVLMARHKGMVWRVVKHYLGRVDEFEDILQDVSLSLFQRRAGWVPGQAQFSTWFYRVVANRCLDILRTRRHVKEEIEAGEFLPEERVTAEDDVLRKQLSGQLQDLLAQLPQQQKAALTLYYYQDVSVDEIASELKVTELAARSLLKRGKQKLREVAGPHLAAV